MACQKPSTQAAKSSDQPGFMKLSRVTWMHRRGASAIGLNPRSRRFARARLRPTTSRWSSSSATLKWLTSLPRQADKEPGSLSYTARIFDLPYKTLTIIPAGDFEMRDSTVTGSQMTYSIRSGGVATGYSICPLRGRSQTQLHTRALSHDYSVLVNRSSLLALFTLQTKPRLDLFIAAVNSGNDVFADDRPMFESMA